MAKADTRRATISAWKHEVNHKPRNEKVGISPNVDYQCLKCDATIKCIDVGMWLDGLVHEVSAGYGSDHDGAIFRIAICDTCLTNTDSIELIGDYLFKDMDRDIKEGKLTKHGYKEKD